MFEAMVAQEADQHEECLEFIDLFEKFQKGGVWLSEQISLGRDVRQHRIRFFKLESHMDNLWLKLPEDKRKIIVESLLLKRMLPQEVKKAMQVFNATVKEVH